MQVLSLFALHLLEEATTRLGPVEDLGQGGSGSAGCPTPSQGRPYPWIIRSTAMPNHYYFYILDRDFGPLFIKFCSYFPYPAKLCLNGHEWLKRQLTQRGIPFEPLDNGIRSTAEPRRVQQIADTLTSEKPRLPDR